MATNLRLLDYPSPPRAYRVLRLAADGRVLASVPVPAESDLEALTLAETLKGECAVELWDGLRFIKHFEPAEPAPGASTAACRGAAGLEGAVRVATVD